MAVIYLPQDPRQLAIGGGLGALAGAFLGKYMQDQQDKAAIARVNAVLQQSGQSQQQPQGQVTGQSTSSSTSTAANPPNSGNIDTSIGDQTKPPDVAQLSAVAGHSLAAQKYVQGVMKNYELQRQARSEALAGKREQRAEQRENRMAAQAETNTELSKARLKLEQTRFDYERELDPLKKQHLQSEIALARANLKDKMQDIDLMNKAEKAPQGVNALDGLDEVTKNTVKGMVDGTLSPPSSWALSQKRWRAYISLAKQLDPKFDETNWQQRVETRKDYGTGGKTGLAFRYGNNLIGHLFALDKAYENLNNGKSRLFNSIRNTIRQQMSGDPEFAGFTTVQQVVAEEARKFFAATGSGSLTELKQFENAFSPNASPAQAKAAINQLLDMMHTQYDTIASNWNRVMNQQKDALDFITPRNKQLWQQMGGPSSADNTNISKQTIPEGAPTATSKDGRKAYWDGQKWQIIR